MQMVVQFKKMKIEGIEVFYREAGDPRNPTIVLLHGFPSSSHMYRDLIPLLADRYYVIAPDYPGYGNSSMPSVDDFSYTFEHLSLVIEQLINRLCIPRYILYCHDYGGPIGFRIAVRNPERVLGFVIQNAVAHEVGLGQPFDMFKALWADPSPENKAVFATLVDAEFTKKQYVYGVCNPFRISPDGYAMDQFFFDRPGNAAIQLALGYDYRHNVEQYPRWQQYLRTYQPPTLITWGKNDFNFTLAGAYALARELTCVELVLLCGGHFVLEEESCTVSELIKSFFVVFTDSSDVTILGKRVACAEPFFCMCFVRRKSHSWLFVYSIWTRQEKRMLNWQRKRSSLTRNFGNPSVRLRSCRLWNR